MLLSISEVHNNNAVCMEKCSGPESSNVTNDMALYPMSHTLYLFPVGDQLPDVTDEMETQTPASDVALQAEDEQEAEPEQGNTVANCYGTS